MWDNLTYFAGRKKRDRGTTTETTRKGNEELQGIKGEETREEK